MNRDFVMCRKSFIVMVGSLYSHGGVYISALEQENDTLAKFIYIVTLKRFVSCGTNLYISSRRVYISGLERNGKLKFSI